LTTLSDDKLDRPGFEGAKYVCSLPLRAAARQEVLWNGLLNGDLQAVSTDPHAVQARGPEDHGHQRLHEDPERDAGRGDEGHRPS
jgi:dihydropyrimidinase